MSCCSEPFRNAFGDNSRGQLGDGWNPNEAPDDYRQYRILHDWKSRPSASVRRYITQYPPFDTHEQCGGRKWKMLAATGGTSFGIDQDDYLWAWGDNSYGQYGDGSFISSGLPKKCGDSKWKYIDSNGRGVLGIQEDGSLWGWGLSLRGETGTGAVSYSSRAQRLTASTRISSGIAGVMVCSFAAGKAEAEGVFYFSSRGIVPPYENADELDHGMHVNYLRPHPFTRAPQIDVASIGLVTFDLVSTELPHSGTGAELECVFNGGAVTKRAILRQRDPIDYDKLPYPTVIDGGSGYSSPPDVLIFPRPKSWLHTQASASPSVEDGKITSVSVTSSGSHYETPPTVVFIDASGRGAAAKCIVEDGQVVSVELLRGGSGYSQSCQIILAGGGENGSGASAVVKIRDGSVSEVEVTSSGSMYQVAPDVVLVGGGGSGASVSIPIVGWVESIKVIEKGSGYSTNIPARDNFIFQARKSAGIEVEIEGVKTWDRALVAKAIRSEDDFFLFRGASEYVGVCILEPSPVTEFAIEEEVEADSGGFDLSLVFETYGLCEGQGGSLSASFPPPWTGLPNRKPYTITMTNPGEGYTVAPDVWIGPPNTPKLIDQGPWKEVAIDQSRAIGVKESGQIFLWGSNVNIDEAISLSPVLYEPEEVDLWSLSAPGSLQEIASQPIAAVGITYNWAFQPLSYGPFQASLFGGYGFNMLDHRAWIWDSEEVEIVKLSGSYYLAPFQPDLLLVPEAYRTKSGTKKIGPESAARVWCYYGFRYVLDQSGKLWRLGHNQERLAFGPKFSIVKVGSSGGYPAIYTELSRTPMRYTIGWKLNGGKSLGGSKPQAPFVGNAFGQENMIVYDVFFSTSTEGEYSTYNIPPSEATNKIYYSGVFAGVGPNHTDNSFFSVKLSFSNNDYRPAVGNTIIDGSELEFWRNGIKLNADRNAEFSSYEIDRLTVAVKSFAVQCGGTWSDYCPYTDNGITSDGRLKLSPIFVGIDDDFFSGFDPHDEYAGTLQGIQSFLRGGLAINGQGRLVYLPTVRRGDYLSIYWPDSFALPLPPFGRTFVRAPRLVHPFVASVPEPIPGFVEPPRLDVDQPPYVEKIDVEFDGRLNAIGVIDGGSGYTSPPSLEIDGDAEAEAVIEGPLSSVYLTDGGDGYTSPPKVTFNGKGIPAIATARIEGGVASIQVIAAGAGYTTEPSVSLTGDGTGAAAYAVIEDGEVTSIVVTSAGSGYTSPPSVSVSGGGGSGCIAIADISGAVVGVDIGDGGQYRYPPEVSFEPRSSVSSISIVSRGSGYSSPPAVLFVGGGGSGARAECRISAEGEVDALLLTSRGSGYTSSPSLLFVGGGGTGASATAAISAQGSGGSGLCLIDGSVIFAKITNAGSGYQSSPAIAASSPDLPDGRRAELQTSIIGRVRKVSCDKQFPDLLYGLTYDQTYSPHQCPPVALHGCPKIRNQYNDRLRYSRAYDTPVDGFSHDKPSEPTTNSWFETVLSLPALGEPVVIYREDVEPPYANAELSNEGSVDPYWKSENSAFNGKEPKFATRWAYPTPDRPIVASDRDEWYGVMYDARPLGVTTDSLAATPILDMNLRSYSVANDFCSGEAAKMFFGSRHSTEYFVTTMGEGLSGQETRQTDSTYLVTRFPVEEDFSLVARGLFAGHKFSSPPSIKIVDVEGEGLEVELSLDEDGFVNENVVGPVVHVTTASSADYTSMAGFTVSGGSRDIVLPQAVCQVDGSGRISSVSITNRGSGMSRPPKAYVYGGGGEKAELKLLMSDEYEGNLYRRTLRLESITVAFAGEGYTSAPSIHFEPDEPELPETWSMSADQFRKAYTVGYSGGIFPFGFKPLGDIYEPNYPSPIITKPDANGSSSPWKPRFVGQRFCEFCGEISSVERLIINTSSDDDSSIHESLWSLRAKQGRMSSLARASAIKNGFRNNCEDSWFGWYWSDSPWYDGFKATGNPFILDDGDEFKLRARAAGEDLTIRTCYRPTAHYDGGYGQIGNFNNSGSYYWSEPWNWISGGLIDQYEPQNLVVPFFSSGSIVGAHLLGFELGGKGSARIPNGWIPGVRVVSDSGVGIAEISVAIAGSGYETPPRVELSGGGGQGCTAEAYIDSDGAVAEIVVTSPGYGYTSPPTVSLSAPDDEEDGVQAQAQASLVQIGEIAVSESQWSDVSVRSRDYDDRSPFAASGRRSFHTLLVRVDQKAED